MAVGVNKKIAKSEVAISSILGYSVGQEVKLNLFIIIVNS